MFNHIYLHSFYRKGIQETTERNGVSSQGEHSEDLRLNVWIKRAITYQQADQENTIPYASPVAEFGRLATALTTIDTRDHKHIKSLHYDDNGRAHVATTALSEEEILQLPANVRSAQFSVGADIDTFLRPPISDYARKHLYYLQAFSIFHCDETFFTRREDYNSYQIIYTYAGRGALEYEGRTYDLNPGDGFFIDCRRPHYYHTVGNRWTHSVLHINGALLPDLYEQFLATGQVAFHQPFSGSYQTQLEKMLAIYQGTSPVRDYLASDAISSIITDLLGNACASAPQDAQAQKMAYLARYMEQHFTEHLTLDGLAQFAGISKYHLSRKFHAYSGYAPMDYLTHLRISQARELLSTTDIPANKIGAMVGIHDANNFNRLFKKHTGMTPGAYRKI